MAIKGLDTLADVLAIIKDPAKYEAKLKELQDQVKAYTTVVEAVVKLSEVNDYVANIKETKAKTDSILESAKVQAKEILDTASKKAQNVIASIVEKEATLTKKLGEVEDAKKNVVESDKALKKALEDVKKEAFALKAEKEAVSSLKKDLEEKRSKLLDAFK